MLLSLHSCRVFAHERDVATKLLHPELALALGSERFLTAHVVHEFPLCRPVTSANRCAAMSYVETPLS